MVLLSVDGVLSIISALANIYTVTGILGLGTENTQKFAKHPVIRLIFLFSFSLSVVPNKMISLIATALFFILEINNFVKDTTEKAVDKTINTTVDAVENVFEKIN